MCFALLTSEFLKRSYTQCLISAALSTDDVELWILALILTLTLIAQVWMD